MRTVTFSQPQVRQILDQHFVCFHTSTEGDPTAGESIRHRPNDPVGTCVRGNGPQNLQTLFLTPDGKIFHAVSGFISAEDLVHELEFAADLFAALKQESARSSTGDPESTVIDSHRKRLADFGFEESQIDSRGWLSGGMGMTDLNGPMSGQSPGIRNQSNRGQSTNPFESMIRRQVLADHQFCMRYPLLDSQEFERNPTPLVGNGKSFFMSSSGGN